MIALIPARGGSKGLPGKNTKLLHGVPLIAYTIQAALKAKSVTRTIVTTDSREIAEIAVKYGAEVPFLRPDILSTDTSSAVDVYLHAIEWLQQKEKCEINEFMILLPTTPLRNAKHIDIAAKKFKEEHATTLISVTNAEIPMSWYMGISKNGFLKNISLENEGIMRNRQFSSQYYIPNGAIYILNYQLLKQNRTYYCDKTLPYVMERKDSIDIDTQDDFDYIEFLLTKRTENVLY